MCLQYITGRRSPEINDMNVFSNQNSHKISGKCDIVIGTKGVQFKNTWSTYSVQDIEFGTWEIKSWEYVVLKHSYFKKEAKWITHKT